MRSLLVFGSVALASAFATFFVACAGDDDDGAGSPRDAGPESSLLGDTAVPDADAEPAVGHPCGDTTGLQTGAPWPLRGGCPKRGGLSATAGPQNATIKWSVPLAVGESSPAISAERVVWVGATTGDVVAVGPDGTVLAALHTTAAVKSSPAIAASGLAVIAGNDGNLYGVDRFGTVDPPDAGDAGDAGDAYPPGNAVFQHPLAPSSSSPVIAADGTIYVGTSDGKLSAVSADGASTQWSVVTNDTSGSSPAIGAGGVVYVGSSDKRLYAVTPEGTIQWSFETGGSIEGSPAVGGDDTIYVGSTDGKLYAVATDGTLRWSYATGGPLHGAPAVRGGVVYVGSDDKKLHAVSTVTGAARWTYATTGAVATPIIGADEIVYVGATDGRLYALKPTGTLFFAVNAKGRIKSAPALSDDGTLFVTTETALVAIGP